jgi:hypothetical protein
MAPLQPRLRTEPFLAVKVSFEMPVLAHAAWIWLALSVKTSVALLELPYGLAKDLMVQSVPTGPVTTV